MRRKYSSNLQNRHGKEANKQQVCEISLPYLQHWAYSLVHIRASITWYEQLRNFKHLAHTTVIDTETLNISIKPKPLVSYKVVSDKREEKQLNGKSEEKTKKIWKDDGTLSNMHNQHWGCYHSLWQTKNPWNPKKQKKTLISWIILLNNMN